MQLFAKEALLLEYACVVVLRGVFRGKLQNVRRTKKFTVHTLVAIHVSRLTIQHDLCGLRPGSDCSLEKVFKPESPSDHKSCEQPHDSDFD
jgi:hypothetical protein